MNEYREPLEDTPLWVEESLQKLYSQRPQQPSEASVQKCLHFIQNEYHKSKWIKSILSTISIFAIFFTSSILSIRVFRQTTQQETKEANNNVLSINSTAEESSTTNDNL